MDRTSNIIIAMAVVAGLLGFALGGWLSMERSNVLRDGQRYEDFELPDVNGRNRRLSELEGRVIVLNFWATWCPPCVAELPMLSDLERRHRARGLTIVGVAEDDANDVRKFLLRYPSSYLQLLANPFGESISARYGNLRRVLPFTVVIDRDGVKAWQHFGAVSEAQLMAVLEPLLEPAQ